jgi:2-keto-4-pentenoate hydratase/2-oxohepta-3-ene-1,7-dioic acid hydratase in catechol pathway
MAKSNPNITRIFCIGLNYVDHIRELSNAISATAVMFMKPATCAVGPGAKNFTMKSRSW